MTLSSMFGATTLIIAISACAALLPTVSIMCAAFSVKQPRLVDLDARLGDALAHDALLGQRPAEGDAALDARAHRFERALGQADQAHAVVDAARPEPALRDLEAAAFAEQDVVDRHAHVLELDLGVAVRRVVVAEHRAAARTTVTPGVSRGTRIIDCCWWRGASGSVLPMKMKILQRGSPRPRSTICGR